MNYQGMSNAPCEAIMDLEFKLDQIKRTFIEYGIYEHTEEIETLIAKHKLLKKTEGIKQATRMLEEVRKSLALAEIVVGNT